MKFESSKWPLLLVSVLSLTGCDAPTDATSLDVELTAGAAIAEPASGVTYTIDHGDDPDEIVEYPWQVSFAVMAQEQGGTAVDVTSVNLTVRQASGGIVVVPSGGKTEHYQFNSSATTNRLNANGSVTMGFQVWYDLPNGGREALVTVTVGFRDDDGRSYSGAVEVVVS